MQLKLDIQFFAGEKTEKATPKKREEERKKGQVAKSQDVNTSIILLFSFIVLFVAGSFMKNEMLDMLTFIFTEKIHETVTMDSTMVLLQEGLIYFARLVAPIMAISVVAAVAANLLQVGILFTSEPLKFDLKKINPIQGAKRIFSVRAIVELLKSLLKIAVIGTITFSVIWLYKDDMMQLAFKPIESAVAFFGQVTVIMGIATILALIFLAVLDYMYQKYDFEKKIRMSKQDIKDEHKNIEGDPFIKSKIKEKQQQMAMSRMMQEVPEADVVITNPTHFAIAIKYDESITSAPYVIAKGQDEIALKIKEIAKEHGIMMVEDKALARSMYDAVKIDEVIPEQFYQAIAEILAFVYQLNKKVN